jgi:alkaline phosphatase
MGLSQVTYGIIKNPKKSNFERFKNIGLVKTASLSDEITDSAASASAFVSGIKTNNGAICLDKNNKSQKTIFEIAKEQGMSTGLVVTSAITHATPAAFYAHQNSRKNYEEIANDFVKSDVDVAIGGGLKFFNQRKDGVNLVEKLQEKGYKIYLKSDELLKDEYSGKVLALLAADHMPKMSGGRKDYAAKSLAKALEILNKNDHGFFLMVEGSQIDWGGHANDAKYVEEEMIDFDQVIGVALDFAAKNKDCLVVVTADHETGGFALVGKNTNKDENYGKIYPKFLSDGHSASMVPIFAYGRGSKKFRGIYENTEIFAKFKKLID